MGRLKRKAVNLLNRFQFADLAIAVSQPSSKRKDWLRNYLSRSLANVRFPSYRPFRNAVPTIYGVQRGLDPSPAVSREKIEEQITRACKGVDVDMNVDVALTLFDLVRPRDYVAYDHPPQSLALGLNRRADIGLQHYLVDGDTLVFQFPYPRRERLTAQITDLMMSMIYHSYAIGDYAGAQIEIADLSCEEVSLAAKKQGASSARAPRIVRLPEGVLISMDDMANDIQSVHDLLIEIGDEETPES